MLLRLFEKIFTTLVGRLPEEKRDKAWEKFLELIAILAEKTAEGAVKGAKSK